MSDTKITAVQFNHIVSIARYAATSTFDKNGYNYNNYDIEEVISITLERVARHWHEYDDEVSHSSWFYTIARNCTCSYISTESQWKKFHTELIFVDKGGNFHEPILSCEESSSSCQADDDLISDESITLIKKEVEKLGDRMGRAIMLQSQGYPLSEIQELVGMKYGALRTMMSRGRRLLTENKEIRGMLKEFHGHSSHSLRKKELVYNYLIK